MKVWIGATGTKFHLEGCRSLYGQVREVELEHIPGIRPCRRCFPDAPRQPKLHRQWCTICSSRRACRHNGGMLVAEEQAGGITRSRWVWPDSAVLLAKALQ